VAAVYLQARSFPFLSFDDRKYVAENPRLLAGLTTDSVRWALSTDSDGRVPLTWLSRLLDVSLFGMDAGKHHLVNFLLHLLNTLLLFRLLRRGTGREGASAFAAALFALHPLHVESVAWVVERKDVLCGFFFLLALDGWIRYAERPGALRYLAAAGLFLLALLSKSMAVTFPFLLLLFDFWPLGRISFPGSPPPSPGEEGPFPRASALRVAAEKVPLLALSAASAAATLLSARTIGAVVPMAAVPLPARVANSLLGYASYLGRFLYPSGLSVFYPYPMSPPSAGKSAAAAILLAAVTFLAWRARGRRPWLLLGWLWFAGMLVPVIGLVQAGYQHTADRFTYLPLAGLCVALSWELFERIPPPGTAGRKAAAASAGALLVLLALLSARQASLWREPAALYRHSAESTRDNWLAENLLGVELAEAGKHGEAEARFREALRIRPDFPHAHFNLGMEMERAGRLDEAEAHYRKTLEAMPGHVDAKARLIMVGWERRDAAAAPRGGAPRPPGAP
jgi:tetratricopeptide (TPR) repeat protein